MCCGKEDAMDAPDLKVHDIQVSDTTGFTAGGGTTMQRRVTYFIGPHGPFTLTYTATDATAARIKSDIKAQVDSLASIHELGA
jgi:hypothetical protein